MTTKHFNKQVLSFFCITSIFLSSCVSYKNIPYFQDLKPENNKEDITNYVQHIIQPKDELLIHVSSLSSDNANIFNNNLQTSTINSMAPIYDYLVNDKGEVDLPLVGIIKVSGLTTDELSNQLDQTLTKYLKEPRVSVRFLNFKVAVLGDVARPNVYTSTNERLTITEALSLAGDLNVTADRTKVILVREINGKREFYHINLNSKDVFESEYFYMKSNDLIFVQPGKTKVSTLETSGYRNASLIITALSVIATTILLIKTTH